MPYKDAILWKKFSDRGNSANIMWKYLGSIMNPDKHKKTFRIPYLIKEGISIWNDHEIANTMNRHFCNIGPELACRLPSKIDGFKKFLSNKIDETIFLSPTSEQEISKEISKLKPNKSFSKWNLWKIDYIPVYPAKCLQLCSCPSRS